MIQERKAIRVTWEDVSALIQSAIQAILDKDFVCKAKSDDYNYWSTSFMERRMMMSEVFTILEQLEATEEQRLDSLPEQEEWTESVDCIGMSAGSLLLSYALNKSWKEEYITDEALWLLDVTPKATNDKGGNT